MSIVELTAIPYVKHVPTDGRRIPLSTFYDSAKKQWIVYRPHENKALEFHTVNLVKGLYVAEAPADPEKDVRCEFAEFVLQHFSVPSMINFNDFLVNDLANQLATIQKYFVILQHVNTFHDKASTDLMYSEIEYSLSNWRSFYDLINRAIMDILKHSDRPQKQLPDSFMRVIGKSSDELRDIFHLPQALIDFYRSKEQPFRTLHDIRDKIMHHGSSPDLVFSLPDGFGIAVNRGLFSELRAIGIWPNELLKPNEIGSLLAYFNFLVRDVFDTLNILAQAAKSSFYLLPEAVAPGYYLYLRSAFTVHLAKSDYYQKTQWVVPETALGA